jgi:uncharacterized protein YbjT (DUF2867 family)
MVPKTLLDLVYMHSPTTNLLITATMTPKTVFVTRATGTQGIAVTKKLLLAGYNIHGIVTNPNDARSAAYIDLSPAHIKLFTGSLDDISALEIALAGCTALFLNLMPNFIEQNGEERQGKAILDTAKEAGVKHVVHSTVLALESFNEEFFADSPGLAPAMLGKVKVEEAVKTVGIERWTILRPG